MDFVAPQHMSLFFFGRVSFNLLIINQQLSFTFGLFSSWLGFNGLLFCGLMLNHYRYFDTTRDVPCTL